MMYELFSLQRFLCCLLSYVVLGHEKTILVHSYWFFFFLFILVLIHISSKKILYQIPLTQPVFDNVYILWDIIKTCTTQVIGLLYPYLFIYISKMSIQIYYRDTDSIYESKNVSDITVN